MAINVFEMSAVLALDTKNYLKSLDKAEGATKKKGSKLQNLISKGADKAKDAMVAGAKAGSIAVIGAMADISKKSLELYGDYEQLAGGAEAIFDEKTSKKVIANAQKAFSTAQLSANDYLDQVTSFSSSLIQSLGGDTEKAADIADVAIHDMSDNSNRMGTDIQDIQNAYQGFAKQNYTMLDNLKLGYGGTKKEMERLLEDAEAISGKKFEMDNFADMAQAIHVIQGELKMTGTSAEEAESTIQGSMNKLKASWKNLLTGFGDPKANVDKLLTDVIKSIHGVIKNVGPAAGRILDNMTKIIEKHGPKAITKGIQGLVKLAPKIVNFLAQLVDTTIQGIGLYLSDLKNWKDFFLAVFNSLVSIFNHLVELVIQLAIPLCVGIVTGLAIGFEKVSEWFEKLPGRLKDFFKDAGTWLLNAGKAVAKGFFDGLFKFVKKGVDKLKKGIEKIPGLSKLKDGLSHLSSASAPNNMRGYNDSALGGMYNSMNNHRGNNSFTVNTSVNLEGRVLAKSVNKHNRRLRRAGG